MLDLLPAAVYITNAAGLITYYNEAAAAMWGHHPQLGRSEWCGSWKLYWPDGRSLPHDQCPMALALREKRPIRGMEAVAERPDGIRVPFIPYPTPLYDTSGELIGAVNMLVDITDRKRAEQYAQRLASIVEFSDDAIVAKDLDGVITNWNRGAERLFGYTAEETIGRPITILIPPDRLDEEHEILGRIRRGEHVDHYETIRRCKDGSLLDISLTISPLKNAEGKIIGASKIARDITERRRAQQQQKLLVNEIQHRIKNTLATVQAIATQTFRNSPGECDAFVARLHALAGAHDLLTNDNWHQAALVELVGKALGAFQEKRRERFLIDGPDGIFLDAQKSSLLVMALHELATNATKYGALSNDKGQVRIAWEILGDGPPQRFRLCWKESGGPPVQPPKQKGFGSLLIERALQYQLGQARLDFDPQGLVCSIVMSL
ncbi:MAG TPA: PAS domain S-box protein [Xanthobacteraceae bacterium]|nr:PAS domain S-box protein [Xanthobacteraceae bacterium]